MMLDSNATATAAPNYRHQPSSLNHRSASLLALDQLGHHHLPKLVGSSKPFRKSPAPVAMSSRIPMDHSSPQLRRPIGSGSMADISNSYHYPPPPTLPASITTSRHHPATPTTRFGDFVQDFSSPINNRTGQTKAGPRRNGHIYQHHQQLAHPNQRLSASTMAIPTLLASPPQFFPSTPPPQKLKPSSARNSPRNSRNHHHNNKNLANSSISSSLSNSNFILRKSKLNLYDSTTLEPTDQLPDTSIDNFHVRQRTNFNADPTDDSDLDISEDDQPQSVGLSLRSPTCHQSSHPQSPDLQHSSIRSFPYSPIAASKQYHAHQLPSPSGNSASSWLGWLSPKFSSVSPSSAAKSASLSYHHLKQVEPDSGFDYSLVPEPVSYRSTVQPDHDLSFLSQSLPYRDRSNSEQSAQPSSINPIVLIPTPTAGSAPLHSPTATPTTTTSINTSTFFSSSARHSQSQSLAQHYSSSSGCSTQSSASSAASFSRSSQKREAAQNFRDFVQHYERGLLECLSSVEQKAAASTAAATAAAAQQPQSSFTVQLQEQQHPPPPTIEPLSSDGDGMQSTAVCRPRLSSTGIVNREDSNRNSSSCFERHINNNNPLSPNSKSLDTSLSSNANDLHLRHPNHISLSNRMSPISTSTTMTTTEAGEDLKKKKSSNVNGNKGNDGDNGTPVKLPTTANNNDNEWSANNLNDNQLSASAVTTTTNASNANANGGGASLNSVLECQSLRLQLAKVRALRDQYETGFKCSEALEKIMKLTKSRECDREWRANERLLADIEKQLEAMIGTIRICVEDLEGWARICPRDNYEIEFRHDKQRRTLRVHIGKALERIWDSGRQEVEFRGALKPSVACRVKEIKSRWHVMALGRRNVTLGVTSISMSELLVSVSKGRPILLDANASGSLKLRIRCSWQPTLISPEDYQNSLNSSGKSRSNTADSSNTGLETGTFSSTYTSSSSAIAPMDDPNQSFRSALSCPQSNRRSFDSSTFIDHPASNSLTPVQCSNGSDGFNSLLTAKVNRNSSSVSSISNVEDSNSNCSRRKPLSSQNRYSSGGDLLSPPSPHSPTMGSSHSGSPSHNFPSGQQSQFGLRKELARSLLALPSNFDHNLHQQQPHSPASPNSSAQQSRRFQYSQLPPPPKSDPSYSKGSSFSSSSSDSLELVVSVKSPSSHSSPTTTNVFAIPSSIQLKVQQIDQLLCSLQSAMEDYRGQFVELALMSSSVERLLQYLCDHFDCPSSRHPSTAIRPNSLVTGPSQICGPDDLDDDNDFDKVEEMLAYGHSKDQEETFSEIEDALAQFDFLDCETDSSTTITKTPNDKHGSNKSNKPSSARKDHRRPTKDHGANSGPLGAPHQNGRLNCSTTATGSRPVYGEDCVDSDEECDDDDSHSKPIIIASYEMPGLGNQQQTSLLPKTQHNNHHSHNHRQQQLNYNNNNNNNRSRSSSKTRQIRPGGKPDRLQTTSDDALLTTELTNGDDCAITTTLPLASREVSDHSKSSWSNSVDPLPPTAQKSSRCCRDPTIAIRNVDQWSAVLILHLQSAIQQLAHVGSWMLKGRETQALERLRADSFAFEQIHHIFESSSALPPDPSLPLGNDPRVLQLWNLLEVSTINTGTSLANSSSRNSVSLPTGDPSMVDGQPGYQARRAHRRHPFILSWRQLSSLLIELMYKFGLGRNQYSDDDLEDNIRNSCEWLSSLIVPVSQTKVTLFDLRAFFELNLWQSTSRTSQSLFNEPGGGGGGGHSDLSLRSMFQIALDVNQLMRKCKKLSFARLEEILFDRFSINASWIPADVTLTIVHYLYENYNHDRSSKLTTSEVKKWDRLREICKIGTNWLIWLLQDGHRYEIREHVLAGLESGSASTRRASCYGIMYIFKMLKRNQAELAKNQSAEHRAKSATGNGSQAANHQSPFYGQEMDSLLYVSMEDQDGRVREEARKALKCLGHYAQQRLSQMERSRMGFFGGMGHTSRSAMASAIIGGQSMPNLNRI